MTTSQTTNLHLTKAVKGTNEPFSIDAINANLDTIDAKVGAVGNTDLQSQVTALENKYQYVDFDFTIQANSDRFLTYATSIGSGKTILALSFRYTDDLYRLYISDGNDINISFFGQTIAVLLAKTPVITRALRVRVYYC